MGDEKDANGPRGRECGMTERSSTFPCRNVTSISLSPRWMPMKNRARNLRNCFSGSLSNEY